MKSKNVRNYIIALLIVAIGVKLITLISSRYIPAGFAGFSDLVKGFTGLGDLVLYGLIILAILLLPYYFSKCSEEKKAVVER